MGCRMILVAFFAFILLLGIAGAALFHYLGWYSLLVIPMIIAALYFLVKHFLARILLLPFQLKGKVLKGARGDVHEVHYLGVEEVDGRTGKKEQRHVYLVDLTIKPSSRVVTPFTMWDPCELFPVSPEAKVSFDDDPSDGSFGSIDEVSLFDNGNWRTGDFDKLHGESRIRLKIRLVKASTACKIRYYFYDVVTVALPTVSETL
jgi:hypothetical protein